MNRAQQLIGLCEKSYKAGWYLVKEITGFSGKGKRLQPLDGPYSSEREAEDDKWAQYKNDSKIFPAHGKPTDDFVEFNPQGGK